MLRALGHLASANPLGSPATPVPHAIRSSDPNGDDDHDNLECREVSAKDGADPRRVPLRRRRWTRIPVAAHARRASADHYTMLPFRQLADRFTLIFYDHRCNGRSVGAPVSSMTWENLTADADALREKLGFERWVVLGHSFGGQVALEYALRYPDRLSHLVLLDTGGDSRWSQHNAPEVLARRGHSAKKVELVRRWFNGEYTPHDYFPIFMRIGSAYQYDTSLRLLVRQLMEGAWRSKVRPKAGDLRLPPPAQRLDGHGPPRRDHRTDAGDGRAERLRVPAGMPGRAGRRDPGRAPTDHRARRAQPARGAARRGHAGHQGVHLAVGERTRETMTMQTADVTRTARRADTHRVAPVRDAFRLLGVLVTDEAMRSLPGDELVADAKIRWNHAITIRAHPADIWPWLVQMGCRRAGWYSYDGLDNGGVPSAERIVPELQRVQVGDILPMTPKAQDRFVVRVVKPDRALVLGDNAGQMSWAFVLEPVDETSTRLITRSRGTIDRLALGLMLKIFWHPLDFGMQRRQLLNLKRLVETA
jgi:pimeloyl-ACP methyl ester carboxylesterase